MRNSVISGNTGTNGGGLRVNGSATITDSTIRGNTATSGGGINLQDAGVLTLTRSTVSGNTTGGGLRIAKSSGLTASATLTNVTISGNDNGASAGSGIMIVGNNPGAANLSLTNVTIGTNTGGGFTSVSTNVTAGSPGSVTLTAKNTMFAGGCGNDGSLAMGIVDQGGNIHTPGGGCPGGDASTNGLLLGALADNGGFTQTIALGATSDALDIGSSCPTTDQRGLPRTGQGIACDSGAFEVKTSGNGPPVIAIASNQTIDEDYPTGPIAYMVADSDTPIATANVAASISSNASPAVPTGSFTFPGTSSGASGSRVLFGTPAADANGSGLVTVQVTDGTDTATAVFTLAANAVNDAPVFNVVGGNPAAVNEDVGVQTVVNFASGMAVGPAPAIAFDESSQTLTGFTVSTTPLGGNLELASLPTVDTSTGTLTYQPVANTSGTLSINVSLSDDGGTGNGGANSSAVQAFIITVNAVNDAPSFSTLAGNPTAVLEDAGAQSVSTFATGMARGPVAATDEAAQTLAFTAQVTGTTGNLAFSTPPAIDASSGALTYRTAANTNGTATVQVTLADNGGVLNGGADTSPPQTFTITVTAVNDAPSFATLAGNPPAVARDAGLQTVTGFATGMLRGPIAATDETGQALNFTLQVTGTTGGLTFSTAPAIDATTGALTYQSAATSIGTATVQVTLSDNGGVLNSGADTSSSQTFTITVNAPAAVNQAPVNSVPGAQTTPGNTARIFSTASGNVISVTDVDAGASNVQVTLGVTSGTLSLGGTSGLTVGGNATSTVTATGTLTSLNTALNGLTFTPSSGFSGSVTLTVNTSDLGNTGSGGTLQDQDTVQITVGGLTTVSINDATATEGNSGSSNGLVFTATLSSASNLTVTVSYTTANGSGAAGATGGVCGTAGVDYQATSGTLTFNPSVVSQPITVPVCGDTLVEGSETLLLTLTSPTNATLADGQGLGTIQDDDQVPTACLPRPPVTVTSANNGDGRLRVTVTAGTSGPNGANRLQQLRFDAGTNALVGIGSQAGRAGAFTLPLPERPSTVTFLVQRATAGQSTTLPFTVVDDCGAWTTFVGGGPTAF
jgi:hypothetical protein